MHAEGPGIWRENWKSRNMRNTHFRTWNMSRKTEKGGKWEIYTLGLEIWHTVDISKFSTFFSFPRHISRPKMCIFHFPWFSVFSPYSNPSVCISHFSRFLVISSFFKSSSGCFSFSMIFSFLAIFLVLQWTFINVPPLSVFLTIFHILKCVFLIFRDFQFSRHIPGPTVCISHFSRFLAISSLFKW